VPQSDPSALEEEMSDDIDKHVLKRYEIATKLGKGV
jgi:hypothetical protein